MQPARRLGLFSAAIAVIAAVLAVLLPATLASAQAGSAAGTRVGASHPAVILTVRVPGPVSAGEGRGEAVSQCQFVVGACVAAEEAGAAGTEAAARAANPARFAVGGDGTVTVRGTEGFYRSAELQEALENLQTASQDAGTVANAGVDVARGPAATGTLQPPGPTLGGYAPPVPTGLPDLSTAIPAVVMAGTAVWMAAQYWWNVWFG